MKRRFREEAQNPRGKRKFCPAAGVRVAVGGLSSVAGSGLYISIIAGSLNSGP